ncbi:MAG: hypothetical protein JWL90_1786, partial [Chthoniobacteraceae bacterium]|nr:hypothetical protein [Chthoniobacteraceae bacterium]
MASSLLPRSLLFLFLVLSRPADAAPGIKVSHAPKQPKSGETVSVTIDMPAFIGEPLLQFQVVEPGEYIALDDPAYSNWSQIRLKTAPGAQDRSVFKAELPAELQKNRRLIRYRLLSGKTVIAPDEDDSAHNFAYFVYDGIPEWRAAINPKGTGKEREAITFSPAVMSSVQAYHLISKQASVEKVTWRERVNYMQPAASQYKYTGTLVADGIVYDHIHFRSRGGTWRYAMGKNMWKIDFNKGHHL